MASIPATEKSIAALSRFLPPLACATNETLQYVQDQWELFLGNYIYIYSEYSLEKNLQAELMWVLTKCKTDI